MMPSITPETVAPTADHRGLLVWRFSRPTEAISSAPVGGGTGPVDWILMVGVPDDYSRTDLSAHSGELSAGLGLEGRGVTMFTAVRVSEFRVHTTGGVTAVATVGVTRPTWAASESQDHGTWTRPDPTPGTINLVVGFPLPLSAAAAVNAVMTVTEAKSQALSECGVPGTGTASDAVAVTWPSGEPQVRFGGPRSRYGAPAARAVHRCVVSALLGEGPR